MTYMKFKQLSVSIWKEIRIAAPLGAQNFSINAFGYKVFILILHAGCKVHCLVGHLERLASLDEDPVLSSDPGAHHDGRWGRQPQRAGASDGQHGDRRLEGKADDNLHLGDVGVVTLRGRGRVNGAHPHESGFCLARENTDVLTGKLSLTMSKSTNPIASQATSVSRDTMTMKGTK